MGNPAASEAAMAGADVVAERAAAEPDGLALTVAGGEDLTFGAWEARSNAVARGLAARGIGAGDRVALLFDAVSWADFAIAWLAVRKAGGVAVLLSPGAARADLARALSHSRAAALVHASGLVLPGGPGWTAEVTDLERGQRADPLEDGPVTHGAVIYQLAPMAPPAPVTAEVDGPATEGWLVHGWAPGSPGGRHALGHALAGQGPAASLGVFDPECLCALVEQRQAVTVGLTPALAAALVASGAARSHDLSSVLRVLVSGSASPGLQAGLEATFPSAAITVDDGLRRPTPILQGPVAVSQEGMLWHEQFTPGSFNLPCLVRRYRGPLDTAALEWALAELVRRHQPLRSTFAVVDGRPAQVVGHHGPFPPAVEDLGGLGPEERDAHVDALLDEATNRPFDLVAGPLFEPRILRLGPDDHVLVVRLHHTVFDDWSVDVLRRELSALYTARVTGGPSPLVEPATTFVDFCRRQRALLDGDRGAAQRAWWRSELAGAPFAVQLPIGGDGEAPEPGAPLRVDLPPDLAAGLRALAPRLRATPFMTVLAAFSVLLARAAAQDDLVIATVVAHRDASDLEPLIGCFTKKVPLRLRLDGDPTFPELVARTRMSLLGALAHQDVAFDAAVHEALGPPAAGHGVVPQVTVVFQGETPQRVKLAMPQLSIGPYEVRSEARRERHFSSGPEKEHDRADTPAWGDGIYLGTFLILSLMETTEGLALVARGVFDRPAARRLLADFQSLLADVVADPDRPVSMLRSGATVAPSPGADVVDLRGFRASRSRIESALARCPGVADVAVAVDEDAAGEPSLVAHVVVDDGGPPPSLLALRHALWATLPGAPWPSAAVVVDAPAPATATDPVAQLLAAMWGEISGREVGPQHSYWQDFSFLQVLAEAREAGLAFDDELVARCRTPEMLAAARAAVSPLARP